MGKIKSSTITFLILFIGVLTFTSCSYKNRLTAKNIEVNSYYASNMVFQKQRPIVIRGTCSRNSVLVVRIEKAMQYVNSDSEGNWEVEFPPLDYKGDFSIYIEGQGETIELKDVAMGQVWVVVGDGWLTDGYNNYSATIKGKNATRNVRFFQPELGFEAVGEFDGEWKVLSRGTIKCYEEFANMFGASLSENTDEKIGIINVVWPGMRAGDFVMPILPGQDTIWGKYFNTQKHYEELADNSYRAIDRGVLERSLEDGGWQDRDFPIKVYRQRFLKDRIVWWRKWVFIAKKFIKSDFTIDLGTVRGQYNFYFNGTEFATFKGETENLKLVVPDTLIGVWANLLTVRMVTGDTLSGFYSDKAIMANADSSFKMNIGEGWAFRTYWEPSLPKVQRPDSVVLPIVDDVLEPLGGINAEGLIVAGGYSFYAGGKDGFANKALARISNGFSTENKFLFLLPQPRLVDSVVNSEQYNKLRSQQLIIASELGYDIVNSINVNPQNITNLYKGLNTVLLEEIEK